MGKAARLHHCSALQAPRGDEPGAALHGVTPGTPAALCRSAATVTVSWPLL
jgi:hypothetical protein